jgi:hypothetical protein
MYFLVDAVGCPGAQDTSAEDRGFEFEVGGLPGDASTVGLSRAYQPII